MARGRLTAYAKDTFIAPKLSALTKCGAPDLSEWQTAAQGSLRKFIPNSIMRVSHPEKQRQYLFNFMRRVEGAIEEYANARRYLIEHESPHPNEVSKYMLALMHFENCVSQLGQANRLAERLLLWDSGERLYAPRDGSPHQRLDYFYNVSKHIEKRIYNGQMPKSGTVPIWITDQGLECQDVKLEFGELANLLDDISRTASYFADLPNSAAHLEKSRR